MKIRFYLKNKSKSKKVKALVEKFAAEEAKEFSRGLYEGVIVDGLSFKRDEHGYFTTADHFLDGMPERIAMARLPIRMITIYDEGVSKPPALGVYKDGNVEAIVDEYETRVNTGSDGMGGRDWVDVIKWRIRIQSPGLDAGLKLFRQIRAGDAEPDEIWLGVMKQIEADRLENEHERELASRAAD